MCYIGGKRLYSPTVAANNAWCVASKASFTCRQRKNKEQIYHKRMCDFKAVCILLACKNVAQSLREEKEEILALTFRGICSFQKSWIMLFGHKELGYQRWFPCVNLKQPFDCHHLFPLFPPPTTSGIFGLSRNQEYYHVVE